MTAKAFMIQGTGSNVGKSLAVAGLCRHFTNSGLKVRPFKPQNMSNNAAVTMEGGEIGRAQALQAMACRTDPINDMNPVLLKPEGEMGSQLIVNGQMRGTFKAKDYYKLKSELLTEVIASFGRLKEEADLVIVEGAGSASEINLRSADIANMGFATATNLPVFLLGDIERGGVIANLIGTHYLLDKAEKALVKGFFINKFRGDQSLFDQALIRIQSETGWLPLGVVPWFKNANDLPAEDSQDLQNLARKDHRIAQDLQPKSIKIVIPILPRIANFDDINPFKLEPNVEVALINPGTPLPLDADLILLPGSKSTISDLEFLIGQGWHIDIAAHIRKGGHVLGLCGGYQMLGKSIKDPERIESDKAEIKGLGQLDIETTLREQKTLENIRAKPVGTDLDLQAYEMHIGISKGPACQQALFEIDNRCEGASSKNGKVMGTYLHGLFDNDSYRHYFLAQISSGHMSSINYEEHIDKTLDQLGVHLAESLDLSLLKKLIELE